MEKELDLEIRRKKEEASISLERLAKEHELMRQNALLFAEAIARASQGGSFGTHGDNRPHSCTLMYLSLLTHTLAMYNAQ